MYFPIEFRQRLLAEQIAMLEALQFMAQLLIFIVILLILVILIVRLSGIVLTRLSERRPAEHRQPRLDRLIGDAKQTAYSEADTGRLTGAD